MLRLANLALLAVVALAQAPENKRIGIIDFFGYKGIDVDKVRAALPVHMGGAFNTESGGQEQIIAAIAKTAGKAPTDVNFVCCDADGNGLIYIGLPGASSRTVAFHAPPSGTAVLPDELVRLSEEVETALIHAIMNGHAGEDRSAGYSLSEDGAVRAMQLRFREAVLRQENAVFDVLGTARDSEQRALAAEAAGYALQSDKQIAALVEASFDADSAVRNNAVRALLVLLDSKLSLASRIPARQFVPLLASDKWSDRNKGSLMMEALTRKRDPRLLAQLRRDSLGPLMEIARWRNPGHAYGAKVILGRIAGITESRLAEMDVEAILKELGTRR